MADIDTVRNRFRRLKPSKSVVRLIAFVVVVALAIGVTLYLVWQNRPTKEDLLEQAGMIGKAELLVGVKDDIPGVAFKDPQSGVFSGFDIDIAYLVAADLGFRPNEVRFLMIEDEDRSRMRASDGQAYRTVDLVIASYSITAEREAERGVSFSDPYLVTEQSVVTLTGHPPIQHLSDLRDKDVCTISTSTSNVQGNNAGAKMVQRKTLSQCFDGLRRREFPAVTSDAAILAGFVDKEPEVFRHHDIGLSDSESWGVNTGGNEALRTLVNLSLYRSLHDPQDKRWEDAYDKHLRPLEAKSLPQPVAIDRQPEVDEVEVRQWPWEKVGGLMRLAPNPVEHRRRWASSGRWRCCRHSR